MTRLHGTGKEKVLVMHNWFGDCKVYEPMLPYLNSELFTFAFFDFRGYGQNKTLSGKYTLAETLEDAHKLLERLGWDEYHIICHSMSALTAQQLMLKYPNETKKIIAITPTPACGSPSPPEIYEFLQKAASTNDSNAIASFHLLTKNRYTDFIAKQLIAQWKNHSTLEARLGYLDMFSNSNFTDSIKGLTNHMLVLFGQYDMEQEEDRMKNTFLSSYPNAKLECCPNAGHFPMQETPMYLASQIERFLCS